MMPVRVQRKRAKGYRLPPNTISVCRPGKFGNPFNPSQCRAAGYEGTDLEIKQRCVDAFRAWLCHKDGWLNWQGDEAEKAKAAILEGLKSLRGKNLACFCKLDEPCHADVLLELANKEKPTIVRRIGDFDVWYKPCSHCGYDTAKSRVLEDPRCWKCGRHIQRDYSDRALKKVTQ